MGLYSGEGRGVYNKWRRIFGELIVGGVYSGGLYATGVLNQRDFTVIYMSITPWKLSNFRVWSVFSCIPTEYEDTLFKSPYSVRLWETT